MTRTFAADADDDDGVPRNRTPSSGRRGPPKKKINKKRSLFVSSTTLVLFSPFPFSASRLRFSCYYYFRFSHGPRRVGQRGNYLPRGDARPPNIVYTSGNKNNKTGNSSLRRVHSISSRPVALLSPSPPGRAPKTAVSGLKKIYIYVLKTDV